MKEFQAQMGDAFKPAALLEKLVAEGKKFADAEDNGGLRSRSRRRLKLRPDL